MITVFKCPYYDECHKAHEGTIFLGEDPLLTLSPGKCKSPFLELFNDEHGLCLLNVGSTKDWDSFAKDHTLKLRKITFLDKIKRRIKCLNKKLK